MKKQEMQGIRDLVLRAMNTEGDQNLSVLREIFERLLDLDDDLNRRRILIGLKLAEQLDLVEIRDVAGLTRIILDNL